MENFEIEIAELLEVDSVTNSDVLKDFDAWDSLTVLSIIAYADESHHITVSAQEVNTAGTVSGLKALFLSKKDNR